MALEQIAARLASPDFGFKGMFTEQRRRADEQDAIAVNAGLLSLDQNYDDLSKEDRDKVTQALLKKGATASQIDQVTRRAEAEAVNKDFSSFLGEVQQDKLTSEEIQERRSSLVERGLSAERLENGLNVARNRRSEVRFETFVRNSGPQYSAMLEQGVPSGEILKEIKQDEDQLSFRTALKKGGVDTSQFQDIDLTSAQVVRLLDERKGEVDSKEFFEYYKGLNSDPSEWSAEEREKLSELGFGAFGSQAVSTLQTLEYNSYNAIKQAREMRERAQDRDIKARTVKFRVITSDAALKALQPSGGLGGSLTLLDSAVARRGTTETVIMDRNEKGELVIPRDVKNWWNNNAVKVVPLDAKFTMPADFKYYTEPKGPETPVDLTTEDLLTRTPRQLFPATFNLSQPPK